MSSTPTSPKSSLRRKARSYVRETYEKLVGPYSRSSSQLSISGPGSSESRIPPKPGDQPDQPMTTAGYLAPPSAEATTALRHSHSGSRSNTSLGLRVALEALHQGTSLFPPLRSATSALISCLDTFANNQTEYKNIASEIKSLSESLAQHMKESRSFRVTNCIANIAISIEQQAKLIKEKQERGTGTRLIEAMVDDNELLGHYKRIESLFRQLQTDTTLSMLGALDEHVANTRLESLTPAKLASYDSTLSTEIHRRTCTEGTRTAILSGMETWSCDLDAPELYWMDGMAGTGKTTIACSFSKMLEGRKQLAASFFCTRTSPECRQVSRIVPTIAYQLARYSVPFQSTLCEILGNEPDIGSKNVVKQVERLLVEPLAKVREAMPDNLVVVIDALDECEDRHGVKLVLDLLFKFAPNLPLKFFVTSRPEPEIYEKMVAQSRNSREVLHLHEIEKSLVKADIELFLREELSFMEPSDDAISQLVERSGNLFIYAATLVRYVRPAKRSANPQRRLKSALAITSESTSKYAEVDALYMAVLESVLDEEGMDSEELEDVRIVLQTVLCGQEPITIETLTTLASMETTEHTLSALQLLRSVLHFSDSSGLVSIFHASFPDFMFDGKRSGPFFCDMAKHNELLARQCFEVMKKQLRFNICNLESSFVPDSVVPNLEGRIKQAISPTLSYVSRYWGDHLRLASYSDELRTVLQAFLSIRLLFWMEVMNLKRDMGRGIQILVMAKVWLQAINLSPDLELLVEDALSFVMSYSANPISQSTPHIYVSLLPLCPKSSSIFQHYQKCMKGMVELTGDGLQQRETAALASWVVGAPVRSVAYSLDGSRVAFGCDDGTVGVRNAYDGTSIVSPFKAHNDMVRSISFSPDRTRVVSGSQASSVQTWSAYDGSLFNILFQGHTGNINSVAFSFDGSRLVTGSADSTVRVWRANDGAPVGDPFEGHTGWVRSVDFSPDATHIVSGSDDRSIRVWNIETGALVANPFRGHTGIVHSVAFSPNGKHIASGSSDCTVRVWQAQTGVPVTSQMAGHTAVINSVAFSPDGARIASGSSDFTIRVWSLHSGTLIAGPFEGHIDKVMSVAFSSDGIRVISGSLDSTVQVWNTRGGLPITCQSEGHTNGVWSVAVSPDGTRIASGSSDHTFRVWDAQDGAPVASPFKGHTERVWSVAFSPDGARIVSSSADRSIRMWNAQDGTPASSPLRGHTDPVNSVAFSSDGVHIVSGSRDRTIRVWDSLNNKLVAGPLKGHSNVVISVAFSPNGTRFVSGSYDSTVRIWNIKGELVAGPFRGHSGWVNSVAFSPDGTHVASGSTDRTIRVWNTQCTNSEPTTSPFVGHSDAVLSVAFSPDGTCILSGSKDRTARIWSRYDGTLVAGPFYGHSQWVTSVVFLPDGAHFVSGSNDHTIRLWNIQNSAQVVVAPPAHSRYLPVVDRPSASDFSNWAVTTDGWITGENERLLFWVPREVLRSLLTPHCKFIINRSGSIAINFTQALLGDRWHTCYIPV
ncbi:hypothetical protein CTheo_5637 [Ceratobasidium theobromae]|uniref:NACHT domain-containing protein n=1 Tax=Ceratobasidium theobromae TaxID=1582974 RepID=A0A5N5QHH3_9AGAM|nr:hypothetical protein CTheo_5637 [Ceratobasidium theobromae]